MFKFLKSAIVNGLVALIPLVLLFLAIKELIALMISIATPIADLFPAGTFDNVRETEILAVLLILGTALLLGLLSKVRAGRVIGRGIEKYSLNRIPMYRMLKSFIGAFLNQENEDSFKPAFISNATGDMEPCYVIEDRGRPRVVVLIPWAPTAFAGAVKLVPRESVQYLPVTLDEFSLALTHLGIGLSELLPEPASVAQDEKKFTTPE